MQARRTGLVHLLEVRGCVVLVHDSFDALDAVVKEFLFESQRLCLSLRRFPSLGLIRRF